MGRMIRRIALLLTLCFLAALPIQARAASAAPAPVRVTAQDPAAPPDGEADALVGVWKPFGVYYQGMRVSFEQVPSIASMYEWYRLTVRDNGEYDVFDLFGEVGTWERTQDAIYRRAYRLLRQYTKRYMYSKEQGAYEELTESDAVQTVFLDNNDTDILYVCLDADYWLMCSREGSQSDRSSQGSAKQQEKPREPTSGEKNALGSAKAYLRVMAFSRSGLIKQLEYEGYTSAEAQYGADHCGADWYEQAVLSARAYLKVMSFSRSKLIDQLEYEGFTHDQAIYGVDKAY